MSTDTSNTDTDTDTDTLVIDTDNVEVAEKTTEGFTEFEEGEIVDGEFVVERDDDASEPMGDGSALDEPIGQEETPAPVAGDSSGDIAIEGAPDGSPAAEPVKGEGVAAVVSPPGSFEAELQSHLADIEAANALVDARHQEWMTAKEEAKEARECYDAAVASLTRTIRNRPERLPLFDGPSNRAPSAVSVGVNSPTPAPEAEATAAGPVGESINQEANPWLSRSIVELSPYIQEEKGISPSKIVQALFAGGCSTVGRALEERAKCGDGKCEFKGIGKTKWAAVCEALNRLPVVPPDDQAPVEAVTEEVSQEEAVSTEEGQSAPVYDAELAACIDHFRTLRTTDEEAYFPASVDADDRSLDPKWDSGFEAFNARDEITLADCPYTPGPERDSWIKGWCAGEEASKEAYGTTTEGGE